MIEVAAIGAAAPTVPLDATASLQPPAGEHASGSFAALLTDGLGAVEEKVARADALVRQFAIDDSVPVHQVTIALEEARLATELAMQVRARIVEGYRELMNMQL
jgi:flagellar hook-basal body complex protein FliE